MYNTKSVTIWCIRSQIECVQQIPPLCFRNIYRREGRKIVRVKGDGCHKDKIEHI